MLYKVFQEEIKMKGKKEKRGGRNPPKERLDLIL